jgi:uncharacterized protein YjiS (DUF1127 family)
MPSLMMQAGGHSSELHQKNWGRALTRAWRRWCLRSLRHSQRKVLRDLVDDPHLLDDIGVTRDDALKEAERRVWDITDVYLLSV